MSCIEHTPAIRTLIPDIAEEKRIHNISSLESVCEGGDSAISCEKVALLRGKINTRLIYTVPSNREYLGYHCKDLMGAYSVYGEKFSAGANFALNEHKRRYETAKTAIDLHAGIPIGEGKAGGVYDAESSKKYSDHQDYQTNQTVIRIVVSGGKNGCWCCSDQSQLEIFACSRKKESSASPRHPNEPIDDDKILNQQVLKPQNTADMTKQHNASHSGSRHPCQDPADEIPSPREE